jgi:hypothetical protein
MSPRVGSWMMGVGALGAFAGMLCFPGALGSTPDQGLLGLGASLFSLGGLTMAGGLYVKARSQQGQVPAKPAPAKKRVRGGCELCGSEAPVVQCKVHELQLCGSCLNDHYDFRSCNYVPAVRRPTGKAGKSIMARGRGV